MKPLGHGRASHEGVPREAMDHLGLDPVAVGHDEVNVIPTAGHMIIDDRLLVLGSL